MKHLLLSTVLLAGVASCAGDPAKFNTALVADYSSVPHASVSVLGVYRNGRMDAESWDEISGIMLAPLHIAECEGMFSAHLRQTDLEGASAIDETTRAAGVTDGFFDAVSPMASGDVVLLFIVSGKLPTKQTKTPSAPAAPPTTRGRGGRGRSPGAPPQEKISDALEISATLYSRASHRQIAVVTLSYSGASVDEALQRFAEKLATIIPGATCSGWNWATHLDSDRIRKLSEP